MITRSDITHMERLRPTVEVISPLVPTPAVVVVYDVEVTDDPTGTNPYAYAIVIPGEMNYDDASMTRKKRLAFVMGMWYLQNELQATLLIQQDLIPNTMQAGKSYGIALTQDYELDPPLGRPHLYHPKDTRYSYPYNIGTEVEDDESKNNKPSKWDNIKQALRKLWNAKLGTALMRLLGMLFVIVLIYLIGPILKSCQPGIVAGSIVTVTCVDGTKCENFLYLGADCVTYIWHCCTGILDPGTGAPGWEDALPWIVGGGVAIGIIALLAYAMTRKKEKMGGGAPVIYALGGGYTPPPPPPVGGKA